MSATTTLTLTAGHIGNMVGRTGSRLARDDRFRRRSTLDFSSNGSIAEQEVDEETYIARYIIARQQTFARIHIVRFAALFTSLNRYNALHEANVAFFDSLSKRFYDSVVRSGDKSELFWKEFIDRLSAMIRWRYKFGEELGEKAANAPILPRDRKSGARRRASDLSDRRAAILGKPDPAFLTCRRVVGRVREGLW